MKTVARYESDPAEKDGRKELRALAETYEHQRDIQLARYHHYEFASAAYQIGIVLASAAVITGMMALVYGAIGLGVIGLAFMALGSFNPQYLHSVPLLWRRSRADPRRVASHMEGALVDRQRRLLHRLGERRVRVAGAGDVLGRGAELHGNRSLRDHVAGVRPD